jgi:hypothetical protein
LASPAWASKLEQSKKCLKKKKVRTVQNKGLVGWLATQPASSIFLSHQFSTSQPAVFFSHNKSASAIGQPNEAKISALPWVA